MKNNQKGITLVALVITIIVLLILAGVTIASLSGDNGILNRGKEAKTANEIGNAKDLINVGIQEGMTAFYNTKYAGGNTAAGEIAVTQKTLGGYLAVALKSNGNTAKSVIASIDNTEPGDLETAKNAKYTITTNVNGTDGSAMTVEMDANGKLSNWQHAN